ncbi:hypothetical protein BDY19DRAFT_911340 [Irpex rosettiformis]|uniref:Uncharacterized protein n=1 Tax=Irpex rosettiformis TaxID=378272 RepID=A0ACB8UJ95_9APHY|nr:hypothetical protein BDY19DRAFT_911340 [Irpex rosettiformis]
MSYLTKSTLHWASSLLAVITNLPHTRNNALVWHPEDETDDVFRQCQRINLEYQKD